jgi:tRNA threonylcarbamoyl adenosine modification protein (Sua5/YciO/YrdC/YwlC family)
MTDTVSLDDVGIEPAAGVAAAALRAGGVVAVPTDTVYGLAAIPRDPRAMHRLFALKGRSRDVPVAVLCADAEQALALADPASIDERVRRAAERGWPGPLTLVLHRRPGLALHLGEPETTVGVRCPDDPLVRALAAEVGPVATTSANRHGEPTARDAAGVAAAFPTGLALIVDGGPRAGAASTVVDATAWPFRVLRAGALALERLTG